jgi:hypothetical protein
MTYLLPVVVLLDMSVLASIGPASASMESCGAGRTSYLKVNEEPV